MALVEEGTGHGDSHCSLLVQLVEDVVLSICFIRTALTRRCHVLPSVTDFQILQVQFMNFQTNATFGITDCCR